MQLNEVTYPDAAPVEGYGPGFFRIGGKAHDAPLAVLPGALGAVPEAESYLDLFDEICRRLGEAAAAGRRAAGEASP